MNHYPQTSFNVTVFPLSLDIPTLNLLHIIQNLRRQATQCKPFSTTQKPLSVPSKTCQNTSPIPKPPNPTFRIPLYSRRSGSQIITSFFIEHISPETCMSGMDSQMPVERLGPQNYIFVVLRFLEGEGRRD